jgi:hypothetical protein
MPPNIYCEHPGHVCNVWCMYRSQSMQKSFLHLPHRYRAVGDTDSSTLLTPAAVVASSIWRETQYGNNSTTDEHNILLETLYHTRSMLVLTALAVLRSAPVLLIGCHNSRRGKGTRNWIVVSISLAYQIRKITF